MTEVDTRITDRGTLVDPYDYYAGLRAGGNVIKSPAGYLVTRFEDVRAVLSDTARFSSRIRGKSGTQWGDIPTPAMREALARGYPEANTTVTSDPPEHHRFRSLGRRGFLPRRIRQIESGMGDIVTRLIDSFIDDGEVEFVEQFAVPFPLTVIAGFLGVDLADLPRLRVWSDASIAPLSGLLTDSERLRCVEGRVEAQHYFMALIRERAKHRTDDLLSDLIYAEVDGDKLTEHEVLSMALGLLVAGNESTRSVLSNGMAYLSRHPEVAAVLRDDPSRVPQFTEEILRYDAPVQIQYRVTKEDVELGGTAIPAGARVALVLGSANRDDQAFLDADRIDLDRPTPISHVAFGHGEHFCLGAPLARAELRTGFTQLTQRLDDLRPAAGEAGFRRTANVTVRGFQELRLAFTPGKKGASVDGGDHLA